MKEQLLCLLENSYSPYSKFRVACLVEMKDGVFFPGVNVENASYGATICAERNAITNAIAAGYQKNDFERIYLMVDNDKISTPCFMCRQVISEFFELEKEIIMMNKMGEEKRYFVKEMCPYPFNEEDLK